MRRALGLILASLLLSIAVIVSYRAFASPGGTSTSPAVSPPAPMFLSHDRFVTGLRTALDLDDPKLVFRFVFSQLEGLVRVHPTENYYYFNFSAGGADVRGSFQLSARDRDSGVIHFNYGEALTSVWHPRPGRKGAGVTYGEADGVTVRKLDSSTYSVAFEGRTVVFQLNAFDGATRPDSRMIDLDEVFVGHTVDESGLGFFLVFNRAAQRLYWILNEDTAKFDRFVQYGDGIRIGDRTEFAFYADQITERMLLIGVQWLNVAHNNWYDGPFDQLPDNEVYEGRLDIRPYLEAAYPAARGRIDKYGYYLDAEASRVAVAPYLVYFAREELALRVEGCRATQPERASLLGCLTEQVYRAPAWMPG